MEMSQFVYHSPEFIQDHGKQVLKQPLREIVRMPKRETRAPMPKRESTEIHGRGPSRRY